MTYATNYAERHKQHRYQPHKPYAADAQGQRQPYHHPHTALGAAGHWIHLLNVATPLVIGEVVKDADKKWRFLRLASVGGAVLSEAAWTMKVSHDRHKEDEARAALQECQQSHYR